MNSPALCLLYFVSSYPWRWTGRCTSSGSSWSPSPDPSAVGSGVWVSTTTKHNIVCCNIFQWYFKFLTRTDQLINSNHYWVNNRRPEYVFSSLIEKCGRKFKNSYLPYFNFVKLVEKRIQFKLNPFPFLWILRNFRRRKFANDWLANHESWSALSIIWCEIFEYPPPPLHYKILKYPKLETVAKLHYKLNWDGQRWEILLISNAYLDIQCGHI